MVSSELAGVIAIFLCLAAIALICLIIYCVARSTGRPLRPAYPEYLQGDPEDYYMYNRNPANRPMHNDDEQQQEHFRPTTHIVNGRIVPIVNEFYAPPAGVYVPNNGNQRQEQSGMVEYYAPAPMPVGRLSGARHPQTPSQMRVAELQRAVVARTREDGTPVDVGHSRNNNAREATSGRVAPAVASSTYSASLQQQQRNTASANATEEHSSVGKDMSVGNKKNRAWGFGRK